MFDQGYTRMWLTLISTVNQRITSTEFSYHECRSSVMVDNCLSALKCTSVCWFTHFSISKIY